MNRPPENKPLSWTELGVLARLGNPVVFGIVVSSSSLLHFLGSLEVAVAGVEAAKAGGMKCVAVTFVDHHPEVNVQRAGADLVVPSLQGVAAQTLRQLLR